MKTRTSSGSRAAMREITKGVIETVAGRPGDTGPERLVRQQTAAYTMMAFAPHDPVEAMLAGHCVVFDHLFHDSARDLLRGQIEPAKLRVLSGVNGCAKNFLAHLAGLRQWRTRPDGTAARPRSEGPIETAPVSRTEAPLPPAPPEAAPASPAPPPASRPRPCQCELSRRRQTSMPGFHPRISGRRLAARLLSDRFPC